MDRDKAADIEDKEYSEESVEDCQPDSEDDEQTYIYQLAKIKDERLNTVVEADATMENSTLTLDTTEEIDEKQKGSERKDRPSRNAMDSESSYENSNEEGKKGNS